MQPESHPTYDERGQNEPVSVSASFSLSKMFPHLSAGEYSA